MSNKRLFIISTLLFAAPTQAFAYLDPGTGSIILQGLIAALVGVGMFFRNIRDYITGLFLPKKPESDDVERTGTTAQHADDDKAPKP